MRFRHLIFCGVLTTLCGCSTLQGISNGVTTACADVAAVQPLLPQLAGALGVNNAFVDAAYSMVEGGCLTATQVQDLIASIQKALQSVHGTSTAVPVTVGK